MAYNPIVIGQQTQANSQAVTLSNDFKSPATNLPVAVTTGATGLVGGQTVGGQTVNYSLPASSNVISKLIYTASNYTSISNTYKIMYGYFAINNSSASAYLQFVDNANTSSTLVASTASNFTLMIPAYSAANLTFPIPISFTNYINVKATTDFSSTSTNQVATSLVYLTLWVS